MNDKTVSIAWECVHCGKQHIWHWPAEDAEVEQFTMTCEKNPHNGCGNKTTGKLYWIGNECMALVW